MLITTGLMAGMALGAITVFIMLNPKAPGKPATTKAAIVKKRKLPDERLATKPIRETTPTGQAETVMIGQATRTGPIEWEIFGSPDISLQGDAPESAPKAIRLSLSVTNKGNASSYFETNQVALRDSKRRTYSYKYVDATFDSIYGEENYLPFGQIEPDVPVTGYLTFEVPGDASGFELIVSDKSMKDPKGTKACIELKL